MSGLRSERGVLGYFPEAVLEPAVCDQEVGFLLLTLNISPFVGPSFQSIVSEHLVQLVIRSPSFPGFFLFFLFSKAPARHLWLGRDVALGVHVVEFGNHHLTHAYETLQSLKRDKPPRRASGMTQIYSDEHRSCRHPHPLDVGHMHTATTLLAICTISSVPDT